MEGDWGILSRKPLDVKMRMIFGYLVFRPSGSRSVQSLCDRYGMYLASVTSIPPLPLGFGQRILLGSIVNCSSKP